MSELTAWPTVYKCPYHGLIILNDEKKFEEAKKLFFEGGGRGRKRQQAGRILSETGYAGPKRKKGFTRDQIQRIFSEWEYDMRRERGYDDMRPKGPTALVKRETTDVVRASPRNLVKRRREDIVKAEPRSLARRERPKELPPHEGPKLLTEGREDSIIRRVVNAIVPWRGKEPEPEPEEAEWEEVPEEEIGQYDCPNCFHIHGQKWRLNHVEPGDVPPEVLRRLEYYLGRNYRIGNIQIDPNQIYYCDSCRNYFFRFQHRLIPIVNDHCELCGQMRGYEVVETGGAHTNKIYNLQCPTHGKGLWGCELAEQDFKEYMEFRKRVLIQRVNRNQANEIERLKNRRGVGGVGGHGQWKDAKGDMLGEIGEALGTGRKRQNFGDQAKKHERKFDIERRFIDEFGVRPEQIDRLPREQQGEAGQRLAQIQQEVDQGIESEATRQSKNHFERSRWGISRTLGNIGEKTGPNIKNAVFSLVLVSIGIFIAAAIGSTWLIIAACFAGLYVVTPNPEKTKYRGAPPVAGLGMFGLMFNKENGINSGIATVKGISKIMVLMGLGMTLLESEIPLSALALFIFCLYIAAGGMHITYDPRRPDQIMESAMRLFFVIFASITIFGLPFIATQGSIFKAPAVGILYLAFFAIIPKPTDNENLARVLGRGLAGVSANYEFFDKIIFIVIMLLSMGASFLNLGVGYEGGLGIGFFSGGPFGIVFSALWVIGLIVGLATPSDARPAVGILIVFVAFLTFGSTVGEQAMGSAFFGQWWPTIHNTANEILEPMGELFDQIGQTFGQSFLLLTNPVQYATQITQGQYTENPLGPTGAYGLELENFNVDSIYLDEDFSIRFELANKGPYTARNLRLSIASTETNDYVRDPTYNENPDGELTATGNDLRYDYKKWTVYEYVPAPGVDSGHPVAAGNGIIPQDVKPFFYTAKFGCSEVGNTEWGPEWIQEQREKKIAQEDLREYYISYMVNYTYEYGVDSNLQVEFISDEEWNNRVRNDNLVRGQVASLVSTAPVKLSIGAMDQPIREGMPFFIGFNITSMEGRKSAIGEADVMVQVPKAFGEPASCTGGLLPPDTLTSPQISDSEYDTIRNSGNNGRFYSVDEPYDVNVLAFALEKDDPKHIFCQWSGKAADGTNQPELGNVPSKKYTVFANSTYEFTKWDTEDTLINFRDVCTTI